MDQLITNPLKRFLYNSKEFAKKQAYKYNYSTTNSADEAIRMSDIKSIMRSPSKLLNESSNIDDEDTAKRIARNNVLFDESADKINTSDLNENNIDSVNLNNNETQRLTAKILEQPVKESVKYLELNKNNCKSHLENNKLGEIVQVSNVKSQTPVIKIKVKVPKGTLNNEENQKFTQNFEINSVNVSDSINGNCETSNENQSVPNNNLSENNDIIEVNTNVKTIINKAMVSNLKNSINNAKPVEKSFEGSKHKAETSCIFDENRTRPLSPIPVLEPTDIRFHFRAVEDLINFHEKLLQAPNKMTHSKLPRMGTSALVHRSPPYEQKTYLDDSEIISALVRDRFVVNMYETRSYRRSQVKNPGYGRMYRSLERSETSSLRRNKRNVQLNTTDTIVPVKQSSPIQFKDQFVSLNAKNVVVQPDEFYKREDSPKPTEGLENLISVNTMQNFIPQSINNEDNINQLKPTDVLDKTDSVIIKQDFVQQPTLREEYKKEEIPKPIEERKDQIVSINGNNEIEEEQMEEPEEKALLPNCVIETTPRSINTASTLKQQVKIEDFVAIEEEFSTTEETNCCNETQELESISSGTISEIDVNSLDKLEIEESIKHPAPQMDSNTEQVGSNSVDCLLKLLENADTDVSYNMDDFLEKALGDELCNYSNLDSTTEIESKIENSIIGPNTILQEDSICTSDASDLVSKINTIQSNFYRSLTKKLQHMSDTLRFPMSPKKEKNGDDSKFDSEFDTIFPNNEQVGDLVCQAAVQFEAMKQITKALAVCRNMKEFTVSTEQVEGERLLLVATYKRQALLDEIRRLDYEINDTIQSTETGTVLISDVTLPLKAGNTEQVPTRRDHQQWYVGIFSYGPQVFATQPTLATTGGNVRFSEEIIFTELPSDFTVNVEVYSLLQRRMGRNFSHESKYHINKGTKTTHCPTPKKFLQRDKQTQKNPIRFDNGIRTSSFKQCGSLKLSVADLSLNGPWILRKVPLCSMLDGSIQFQLQSFVHIPVKHSGFLNIGTEAGGCASWNRRWCVLQGHTFKYWNYPAEEDVCNPLRQIDLKCCVNNKIEAANRALCAKPKTLMVQIARSDAQNNGTRTIERHFLSVDTVSELKLWENQLNIVVTALRTWNVGDLH